MVQLIGFKVTLHIYQLLIRIYNDNILTLWETKWCLKWEPPDPFSMTALDEPDSFWLSVSRMPLL